MLNATTVYPVSVCDFNIKIEVYGISLTEQSTTLKELLWILETGQ